MMDIPRFIRHLLTSRWQVRRAFPPKTMAEIATAISAAEQTHDGELRFVIEGALEPGDLLRGMSPRERAIEVFSQLGVWDTEHNNGVLIYVLLADHAVEIVADRGIDTRLAAQAWSDICREIETHFKRQAYQLGAVAGVEAVAQFLKQHYPRSESDANELPDAPLLI